MPHFVLVPAKGAFFKRKNLVTDAERCVDVIISAGQFLSALSSYGEAAMERLERGVRFRVITEKPGDEEGLPKIFHDLRGHPLFGLRYVPASPRALVTVYDGREMLFSVSATSNLEGSCLWSDNASLLAVVQDYFELMWLTSMETSRYSTDEMQT